MAQVHVFVFGTGLCICLRTPTLQKASQIVHVNTATFSSINHRRRFTFYGNSEIEKQIAHGHRIDSLLDPDVSVANPNNSQ